MFVIEVLKALMRRLLIAGKRMIKALPDEIRDRNKSLLITTDGESQAQAHPKPSQTGAASPSSPNFISVPCPGDF